MKDWAKADYLKFMRRKEKIMSSKYSGVVIYDIDIKQKKQV